jgi:protein SCO1/2
LVVPRGGANSLPCASRRFRHDKLWCGDNDQSVAHVVAGGFAAQRGVPRIEPGPRFAAGRTVRLAPIALAIILAGSAHGEPTRPPVLAGIGVDERPGGQLPLQLPFLEAAGERVHLGDYFDGKRPVLLVLAYVRCKMLCSLVLQEVTHAVRDMPLALDRDYRVVMVSIDPGEEAAEANRRRAGLLERAGHAGETERWTFLLGGERPIRELADALGFRYRWDPRSEQFAHPAVLFVITPDGTISRYLQGLDVAPPIVAAALRRAATGTVAGESLADSVLSCFHFDPAERAHREQIDTFLEVGGGLLVIALGSAMLALLIWDRRRRR